MTTTWWWHPRLIATVIAVVSTVVGIAAMLGSGGRSGAAMACWLLAGVSAGYAASGST